MPYTARPLWSAFGEVIAVYYKNYTEHINTLWGQNAEPFAVKSYFSKTTKRRTHTHAFLGRVDGRDITTPSSRLQVIEVGNWNYHEISSDLLGSASSSAK
jgi:hypothetical protein